MEIQGVVQNGVVVLDAAAALPEGAVVIVTYRAAPVIRVASNPKPVVLPIFDSGEPGTIDLTNDRIAEILDQEDASS
ncbi:MAG: hypothetical protein ABI619_12575 [Betaproteobacteria bacterium]